MMSVSRHLYIAKPNETGGIDVFDEHGEPVTVGVVTSGDLRTAYAHVPNVGFIGGWKWPHKPMPLSHLIDSINRGVLYSCMDHLPKEEIR